MPSPSSRATSRRHMWRAIRWALLVGMGVVSCASVAFYQEVGIRQSPLPSEIPFQNRDFARVSTRRIDGRGVSQVWVPAGWFRRGSDPATDFWHARVDETPQHDVEISSGFWIDENEVTNAAYEQFVADGGYQRRELWTNEGWAWKGDRSKPGVPVEPGFDGALQPRVWISWHEADAYSKWRGGRLPTEAEWEYAARGPNSSIYPWGNDWEEGRARVSHGGLRVSVPAGSHPSGVSWCGANDMAGNAWEWTGDWYDAKAYVGSVRVDPVGPSSGAERSIRGGSCGGPPASARSARRAGRPPHQPSHAVGLRVVTRDAEVR
jgi:formylglycine-generating enzyme required for sulfatase activity